jgi:hypothetical protein
LEKTHKILFRKSEGKRPLQVFIHKLEDNIKMDLEEIGFEDVA